MQVKYFHRFSVIYNTGVKRIVRLNFRFLIYILAVCGALFSFNETYAQQVNRDSLDKAREARRQELETARLMRKKYYDSLSAIRVRTADELKAARKHVTDSMAAMRKYRESRHYKDSVTRSREEKVAAIQAKRKVFFDSLKAARKHTTDSTIASRRAATDKIKSVQKRRADSLTAIRKYRESKRFRDSSEIVKKVKLDNIKAKRKAYNDSLLVARKQFNDNLKAARKKKLDSLTAIRKKTTDSIKLVRKNRTDSLAKAKAKRLKTQEVIAKQKEEKKQLALELKIKKKHQAWSNEKMLKKKWTTPRQIVQNTFTRYNYFYNANRKMDEALANMQRAKKENYDSLIALFPFNPDRDSSLLSADMDSIIQKASIGIQIHDPRTKWGDDLYLLLGQAYYYKGHYQDASVAFRYILSLRSKNKKLAARDLRRAKSNDKDKKSPSIVQADNKNLLDFLKHRSVHNESILWLARVYTQMHQEGNAESVLDLIETDPNYPESMKGRLALEKANIYLAQGDHKGAASQLAIVTEDKNLPHYTRMRAAYLNGQLLMEQQNYVASAEHFKKVLSLNPKIDMDFYARKNLAYASMLGGTKEDEAVASLKHVLSDGKYTNYYEQVYYVMGRLAANNGNSADAVNYLNKSIRSPKTTKKQKAISFATLGNVHYKTGEYFLAKKAYDSAAILSSSAPNDSLVIAAKRRSATLGSITKPTQEIHDLDSLLALSTLTDKEQLAAVRRYIRYLERRKADSVFVAENAGLNTPLQNQGTGDVDDMGTPSKWYFGNSVQVQQGYNDFKRKWGSRPLTDNWRRLSAQSFTSNNSNSGTTAKADSTEDGKTIEYDENGLPTEASLLSFIPNTKDEKDFVQAMIKKAHITLANAYVKELEDYPPAIRTLDTLDKRYPAHEYKDESLYIRYLVALRQNKLPEAQRYSTELVQQYPDSKFAMLVRPSEDGSNLQQGNVALATFYDETYELLLQRQYTNVLTRINDANRSFPESKYQRHFTIMEGFAQAGIGNYDKADSILTRFITAMPTDSLRPWADAALEFVRKNRPKTPVDTNLKLTAQTPANTGNTGNATPQSPSSFEDKLIPNAEAAVNPPAAYTYKPQDEHFVIITIPASEARAFGLKTGVEDFNAYRFPTQNLKANASMLSPSQGFIVVRSFRASGQAKIYMNMMGATSQIFREYKTNEYEVMMISADNYQKLLADKDIKPYEAFYKTNYK